MKYDILLFDADNTILDFDKAEHQALRGAFAACGVRLNNHILQVYRHHNIAQWQCYERGEISRDEVLHNRFVLTLQQLNLHCDVNLLSEEYERLLHLGAFKMPYAEYVLQKLQGRCAMYIVSNGVLSIQNSRMKSSGLEKYFLKRFISEEVGCPKPNKQFFHFCFANIENFRREKTLIIGDSLTGDILGGQNANIDTCWYNPHGQSSGDISPTYQIDDLRKILSIVR